LRKKKRLSEARLAFNHINQCRRLPASLETFLDDLRSNFSLIENEIKEYIDCYELDSSPDHIQFLISRLLEWYKAWVPPSEFGSTVCLAYTLNFQTRLFSLLPSSFSGGFKNLCTYLLAPPSPPSEDAEDSFSVDPPAVISSVSYYDPNIKAAIWRNFEVLGRVH